MKKIVFIFIATILVAVSAYALRAFFSRGATTGSGTLKPQVATSFYPLWFFAKEIAGEYADVVNLTPAGAEPHDYEPKTGDVVQLEKSKLIIVNGGLEPWVDKLGDDFAAKHIPVIRVGQESISQDVVDGAGKRAKDPHVWLSPLLAEKIAARIADGLATMDPAHESNYRANANVVENELEKLDADFKKGLAQCKEKTFVTSHAAFGYLAAQYGLTQIGVAGLSPDAESSLQELANVTSFVREHHIKYIFFETLVSPKLSETIAREVGAATLVLNPLEGLTAEEITAGKSYFTEMESNLANLRIALECK